MAELKTWFGWLTGGKVYCTKACAQYYAGDSIPFGFACESACAGCGQPLEE